MLRDWFNLAGDNVPRLADARVSFNELGFSVAVAVLAAIVTAGFQHSDILETDVHSALRRRGALNKSWH